RLPFPLGCYAICGMYFREQRLYPPQHLPPDLVHERSPSEELKLWLYTVQFPSRLVFRRRVAQLAGSAQVGQPVAAVAAPEPDVVYMQERFFPDSAPAEQAFVPV